MCHQLKKNLLLYNHKDLKYLKQFNWLASFRNSRTGYLLPVWLPCAFQSKIQYLVVVLEIRNDLQIQNSAN